MGQTASGEPGGQRSVTNEELSLLFAQHCARALQPIELATLKRNLEHAGKTLKAGFTEKDLVSETDFQELLSLPDEQPHLRHILYNITVALSQFPLLGHTAQPLTSQGLLKALTLISKERCTKIFKGDFDYTRLIFTVLASRTGSSSPLLNPATQTVVYSKPAVISWAQTPAVKTLDGTDVDNIAIDAEDLLELLGFILATTRLQPTQSLRSYFTRLSKLTDYKKHALPILRAMNPEITTQNILYKRVTFNQFTSVIDTVAPHLLIPLSSLLESLLYDTTISKEDSHSEVHSTTQDEPHHSRLIDEFTVAQLATYFKPELVYSNIRKLYVGRDSGFSMRSFESKVFKWNAPSILLLKGTRITKAKAEKSQRYKKFEEHYPRLPLASPASRHTPDTDDTIIYGVYVDQPWRVTNKDTFGSSMTTIFQLAPVQRVFKASISAKNFVYFSTLGGGIGIGSQLAKIKGNNELVRYNPGNVSLTIDSSLEFAVMRNLGLGGEFKSLGGMSDEDTYEDRFMLSDVEVWGCGGEKELEEQNNRWEWEQQEAKRRQNINLKSMGEDRALLEMAGLIGQHQSGGSI